MNWRYEWVNELPRDVYEVLVEMLTAEQKKYDEERDD